jgi:hypothetical protein
VQGGFGGDVEGVVGVFVLLVVGSLVAGYVLVAEYALVAGLNVVAMHDLSS